VNLLSHFDHLVVKKTNRVESNDADAGSPIVEHASDGPEIIMNFGGGSVLAEAGDPDRRMFIRNDGVDLHACKPDLQRC
jgi:hypothetical protein